MEADAIYLFGVYAHGTPTEDSNFDIYVVIPNGWKFMVKPFTRTPFAGYTGQ